MHKFDYSEAWKRALTPDVVALLTEIHEYKGRQVLLAECKEESLTQLSEVTKLKSTEASNEIEGISVSDDRLKKIVGDKTHPRNENEQKIAGYRDVLSIIHENYAYVPFKPNMILQLYQNLYRYGGASASGASATPQALDGLCSAYEDVLKDDRVDPLIIIPMAISDFLCIRPFNADSGRMGRLLTLLLLHHAGYSVGKYASIEKFIEKSYENYCETLRQSSVGWQENENDYEPFIRYILGVVLKAYKELFAQIGLLIKKGVSKPEKIAAVIKNSSGKITKTEILKKCPDVSEITVQRTLAELVNDGEIIKIGGGRYTKYVWNGEKN